MNPSYFHGHPGGPPAKKQDLLKGQAKVILRRTSRTGLLENRSLYLSRVSDFAAETSQWPFDKINGTVNFWQGLADTWVPPEMANSLAKPIPQAAH